MALSDLGVTNTRNEVTTLSSQKERLSSLLNELETILTTDENYQKFRTGTAKGDAINSNISRIISISRSVIADTSSLISSTNTFLDQTDVENKKGLGN